ncbi:MAG: hypothetical protein EB084_01780 [Proteobacteria bacterium]|nr:hypothetical protein [Pseudomonadota bacterium]
MLWVTLLNGSSGAAGFASLKQGSFYELIANHWPDAPERWVPGHLTVDETRPELNVIRHLTKFSLLDFMRIR